MLFATLITLILVPTAYMILNDVGRTMRGLGVALELDGDLALNINDELEQFLPRR